MSRKDKSFAALMKRGWTKEQLMKHFCLSEAEYKRSVECVERIEAEMKSRAQNTKDPHKIVCQCGMILVIPDGAGAQPVKCKCGRETVTPND